ncbi:MAG: HAD-IA family hydrolase [Burkholderiales bacterium]|nr:MAG: HAD-IA family hydrolase [Burkholderiales bacterium]
MDADPGAGALALKGLILDFGGVISRTLFETHAITERALGLPDGALTWRGPFDPASDPLWQSMLADRISERDYWLARTREVGRMLGEDWDRMETFVKRARGADPAAAIRPEAEQAIRAASRAGIRLAVLSNELDLFYGSDFRDRLPILAHFDVIVDATYTGILKPDARAYRYCLRALGLAADECVFVDDQPRNIAGAQTVGLHTVPFDVREPRKSYTEALSMLGLALVPSDAG